MAAPARKERVLVVDDEPRIREALMSALQRLLPEVEVLTAPDGEEALRVMLRERVDLIVSDQRMPGMAGVDLLTEARRILPNAPRILMTAYPEPDLFARATNEARLARFLPKPFRLEDAVAAVREELSAARAVRERDREIVRTLSQVARLMRED